MPQLLDPNFHRSVVLMIEHNAQGSFGLVLNRPTPVTVLDVIEALDLEWRGDPDATVWSGGPVQPRSGWVLHEPAASADPPAIEVVPGVLLSTAPEQLRALALDPPRRFRFLMGYSGWGPDQLPGELVEGAWLNAEAEPDLIFETPPELLWETVLTRLGIRPEMLVPGTGVH